MTHDVTNDVKHLAGLDRVVYCYRALHWRLSDSCFGSALREQVAHTHAPLSPSSIICSSERDELGR